MPQSYSKMSSEAFVEKPMSGRCRCHRNHSWYIVLISFLVWFTLFYLYSSSITFGKINGSSFLGSNNQTDLVESSSESFHDVARDVKTGDNNENTETEEKSISAIVDQALGEDNETDQSGSGKVNEDDQLSNNVSEQKQKGKSENVSEEENVDQSVMDFLRIVDESNENENEPDDSSSSTEEEQEQPKEQQETKQKETENVSEVPKETENVVVVKSRKERAAARRSRGRRKNKPVDDLPKRSQNVVRTESDSSSSSSSCAGRYIYIHNLPKKFNQDLLDNCRTLSFWTDMCECSSNLGLGAPLPSNEKLYSKTGWFATNQFLLEVIFHNRMRQYKCLTNDPSAASAIYVPYYAGLDVGRYLWDPDGFMRDYDATNLVKWLASRPEWKKMWGRDHFLVAGRINWDFRRDPKNESDWGNELLNFPESRNMTMLVIESSPWNYNDFGIPYPTYFHPSSDADVFQWQNRMRRLKRRYLFAFAGARRPNLHESIRNEIIDQCLASRKKCKFLECDKSRKCHKPAYLLKLFQSSIFCLQPPGDSYTRRSIFDSILSGCIPVFFHPGSAYVQYIWHFPKDFNKFSVLIPANDVKFGKANIERVLQRIPREKRAAMKEEVIKLIPKVIYADPSSKLETIEDAFDITVEGVVDRVETVRKEMIEGKEVNSEFDEEESWKYFTFGKLGVHEWDRFFSSKLGKLGA